MSAEAALAYGRLCAECGVEKFGRAFGSGETVCRECKGDLAPTTRKAASSGKLGSRQGAAYMPGLEAVRKSLSLTRGQFAGRVEIGTQHLRLLELAESRASAETQRRILTFVVNERRRQREAEMERWERIQRAGLGVGAIGAMPHIDELRVRIDQGRPTG